MASLADLRDRLRDIREGLAGLTPTGLSGTDAAAVVGFGVDLERLGVALHTRYAKRVADTKADEMTRHHDAASWPGSVGNRPAPPRPCWPRPTS